MHKIYIYVYNYPVVCIGWHNWDKGEIWHIVKILEG